MIENKVKVAVIDSGMDLGDPFLKKYKVDNYCHKKNQFLKNKFNPTNMHGTEIGKILLREAPGIEIISIQVLDENNKCKIDEVIEAMKFSITKNVNIISMSLGIISISKEKLLGLEAICKMAADKGIVIFAAHHNNISIKAYPASLKCVVGVRTNFSLKKFCEMNYETGDIEFSDSFLYVPQEQHQICNGNSYLTPFVVGGYCNLIKKMSNKILNNLFWKEMSRIYQDGIVERIFFNKETERYILNNKNVVFYADTMNDNNYHIFSMYQEVCNIRLYLGKIDSEKAFYKIVENMDVFFIGIISTDFLNEEKKYINRLVEFVVKKKVLVITVFPILNIEERCFLVRKYGGNIKSIYK